MSLPPWIARTSHALVQYGTAGCWSAADLAAQIERATLAMSKLPAARPSIGLLADNGPQWIAIDLATQAAGARFTPLPAFFSREQLSHVMRTTNMQALFCADAQQAAALGFDAEIRHGGELRLFSRGTYTPISAPSLPSDDVHKISFTSGTTGTPKGVCLSARQQLDTARALAELTGPIGIRRHLNLLPLPVLLENIAGVYAPLMLGATCICPPLAEVGLGGASQFDVERCMDAIARYAPQSVIMLPQMLQALVAHLTAHPRRDRHIGSLKFIAVGGAKTSLALLAKARTHGLPVYEGYGLTECASVVALNVPAADKPGSVGRALPGTTVRAAFDGELEVTGRGYSGYLGMPPAQDDAWLKTGDLGTIDSDGFISITGRKKNILITSFGRNVSPEWPEALLLEHPEIAQAAVFGEARPQLSAVIVAAGAHIRTTALARAVEQVNRELPDYARIGAWIRANDAFSASNGLATANGRPRRDAIGARYAQQLNPLHDTERESEHP